MKPLDEILSLVQTIYSSKKQIKATDIQFIQNQAQLMKNSIIDTLIPLSCNTQSTNSRSTKTSQSSTVSYADAAKRSQKATIVIKAADKGNSSLQQIEEAVCKHLEAVSCPATIHSFKNSSKGNVVVKLNPNDDAKEIANTISSSLGMDAHAKTLHMPKMTMTHIPSHIETDSVTLTNLIVQSNPWLKSGQDHEFEVLFTYKTNNSINAVCKMSPNTRSAIYNNQCKLKIGVKICRLFDRFHIPLCTKCSAFGHKASNCTSNNSLCSFCCSKDHHTNSCPTKTDKSNHKCANCFHSTDNKKKEKAVTHNSFSLECPSYLERKAKLIKSTNWGDGPVPTI